MWIGLGSNTVPPVHGRRQEEKNLSHLSPLAKRRFLSLMLVGCGHPYRDLGLYPQGNRHNAESNALEITLGMGNKFPISPHCANVYTMPSDSVLFASC
jgi:hypothetical protein